MNPQTETFLKNKAHQMRIHSIRMTSAAGSGHPTSCLSAAEIMSVLFFYQMKYDPVHLHSLDNDAFIMSKGHAAPILYAAWAEAGSLPVSELKSLRNFDSPLEGHPVPRLPGVHAATGSLGQGLSMGAGIALALQQDKKKQRAYVLLGDGEMAEGNIWEAMNFASYYKLNNLCAVLDLNRLGQSEPTMFEWDTKVYEDRARAFGWEPVVVDGHSISELVNGFEQAQKSDKPAFIIAKTVKGKLGGSSENADGRHGKPLPEDEVDEVIEFLQGLIVPVDYAPQNFIEAKPFTPTRKEVTVQTDYKLDEEVATRTAFGQALAKIGRLDQDIVVLDGDVKGSSRTNFFFKEFPDRSYETFIAEQNMIGMLIGLQAYGKRAVAATFAAFLTRAHDQIRMAAYSRAKILLAGSHTGVSIGQDGPSQMGLEDMAMMRSVYGSAVFSPCDAVSAEKITAVAANYNGIAYIRTIRGNTPIVYENAETFEIGGSKVIKESPDDTATIAATGITVHEALKAATRLEQDKNLHIRVIDCYSVKPIDAETLQKAAAETRLILTVEDHYPEGGLGEAVAAAVAGLAPVHKLSVTRMPHSGKPEELLAEQGIDEMGIITALHDIGSAE